MLLEAVLWSAAAIGWLSLMANIGARRPRGAWEALRQNRAAVALLLNFALATTLCWSGVPFNFWLWVLIDVATALAIFNPDMRREEIAINLLFPVGWIAYLIGGEVREWGAAAVVVAQFMLVGVYGEVATKAQSLWAGCRLWRHADLMVGVAYAV